MCGFPHSCLCALIIKAGVCCAFSTLNPLVNFRPLSEMTFTTTVLCSYLKYPASQKTAFSASGEVFCYFGFIFVKFVLQAFGVINLGISSIFNRSISVLFVMKAEATKVLNTKSNINKITKQYNTIKKQ